MEWLKWVALLLMFGDHANKALWAGQLPYLGEAARVCFPVFAFVLAFNLSRPGVLVNPAIRRMVLIGVLAQPWHALVMGYFLPLNVMFTLALGAFVASARRYSVALPAWAVLGFFVDYQWFGVGVVVAAAMWLKAGVASAPGGAVMLASLVGLFAINGNLWSLAAVPLVLLAISTGRSMPRWKHLFYAFYPLHLAGLALAALALAE